MQNYRAEMERYTGQIFNIHLVTHINCQGGGGDELILQVEQLGIYLTRN